MIRYFPITIKDLKGINMPQHRVKAKAVIKKKQQTKPKIVTALMFHKDRRGEVYEVALPKNDEPEPVGQYIFEGKYRDRNPVSGRTNYLESFELDNGDVIFMDECGSMNNSEKNKTVENFYGNLLLVGHNQHGKRADYKTPIEDFFKVLNRTIDAKNKSRTEFIEWAKSMGAKVHDGTEVTQP